MIALVPADFEVPQTLCHEQFTLRMLRGTDAEADYEAVMESAVHLRKGSPHGWPRAGFTLAENRADLERHEAEFLAREAFAYSMLSVDESSVLGCVYINPSRQADAEVHMWVRDSYRAGLIAPLYECVQTWLEHCWPFDRVAYVRRSYYAERVPEDCR